MVPIERENRSFVGCGDEEYPKGDITRTAPVGWPVGWAARDEVLSPRDEIRQRFGELMNGHPGHGGEEYAIGDAKTHPDSDPAIASRSEILEELRFHQLPTDTYFYVSRQINEYATDCSHGSESEFKRLQEMMRAHFPEFFPKKGRLEVYVSPKMTCGEFCELIGWGCDRFPVYLATGLDEKILHSLAVCPQTQLRHWISQHGHNKSSFQDLVGPAISLNFGW
ncbi:MAG: hypothetical protein PHX93_03675 [Candidatus Peribacteraceae bacterium]|jgi:hypothetical protein|nr:hypothetical protein [Candidatus Peribacteraceae bacterium]